MLVPCPFVHGPLGPTCNCQHLSVCLGSIWTLGPLCLNTSWKLQGILYLGAATTSDKWELAHQWPSPHTSWVLRSPRIPHGIPIAHSGDLLGNTLIVGFLPFPVSLLHPYYRLNSVPQTGTPRM